MTANHLLQIAGNLIMWNSAIRTRKGQFFIAFTPFKNIWFSFISTVTNVRPNRIRYQRDILLLEKEILKCSQNSLLEDGQKPVKSCLMQIIIIKNLYFSNQDKIKKLRNVHFATKWKYRVVKTLKRTSQAF